MLDRGYLTATGCRCGICRGQFVRARPRTRPEGIRQGWRYVDPWGWCCAVCALGPTGVWTQRKKKRNRPQLVKRAPVYQAPPASPVRGGGFQHLRKYLEELTPPE